MKITAKPGQSVLDIAIQEYGSPEGVIALLQDNPALSIASKLAPGQGIVIAHEPVNKTIRFRFQDELNIATASSESLGGDFNEDFNDDFN